MSIAIKCCKDCQDRFLHCHNTCTKYLNEKMNHDKLMRDIRRQKSENYQTDIKVKMATNRKNSK